MDVISSKPAIPKHVDMSTTGFSSIAVLSAASATVVPTKSSVKDVATRSLSVISSRLHLTCTNRTFDVRGTGTSRLDETIWHKRKGSAQWTSVYCQVTSKRNLSDELKGGVGESMESKQEEMVCLSWSQKSFIGPD